MKKLCAKMCEIVCDINHIDEERIKQAIASQDCIDKWLYILHDKDIQDDGSPKTPHYHIYLHFTGSREFEFIAKWFGLPIQFVSKIKSKRFADAIEYAIHANAPDKHQYDPSEMHSNFDAVKMIESNQQRKAKKQSLASIVAAIDANEINPFNITDKVSMEFYMENRTKINHCFEYRAMRLQKEMNREMQVVYVYGPSGSGKTTYAKKIAQKQGYSVFISSGSNDPFDGYKGQDCVILDDIRGSAFPLSDLLKILDNNTSSSVKARYRNINLECKLLIITTTKTQKEFYNQVFDSEGEEYKQFQRRCGIYAEIGVDTIKVYYYDRNASKYVLGNEFPNEITMEHAFTSTDKADVICMINDLFDMSTFDTVNSSTTITDADAKRLQEFNDWIAEQENVVRAPEYKPISNFKLEEFEEIFSDDDEFEEFDPKDDGWPF